MTVQIGPEHIEAVKDAMFNIHKAGRGWYRPNAQGYTGYRYEAGRFTREQAENYTFPNGPDGPRDGLTYEPVRGTTAAPAMIATIQAQAERVRVLEEALRPLADACEKADRSAADRLHLGMGVMTDTASPGWGVKYGHLKSARAALEGSKP